MPGPAHREQLREIVRGFALVTQVGLLMVASILAGLFLGLWIADFGGAIVGLVLGIAAGFYSCYRTLVRGDFRRGLTDQHENSPGTDTEDEP